MKLSTLFLPSCQDTQAKVNANKDIFCKNDIIARGISDYLSCASHDLSDYKRAMILKYLGKHRIDAELLLILDYLKYDPAVVRRVFYNGEIYISYKTCEIKNRIKGLVSLSTARRSLKRLKENGFISVEDRINPGGRVFRGNYISSLFAKLEQVGITKRDLYLWVMEEYKYRTFIQKKTYAKYLKVVVDNTYKNSGNEEIRKPFFASNKHVYPINDPTFSVSKSSVGIQGILNRTILLDKKNKKKKDFSERGIIRGGDGKLYLVCLRDKILFHNNLNTISSPTEKEALNAFREKFLSEGSTIPPTTYITLRNAPKREITANENIKGETMMSFDGDDIEFTRTSNSYPRHIREDYFPSDSIITQIKRDNGMGMPQIREIVRKFIRTQEKNNYKTTNWDASFLQYFKNGLQKGFITADSKGNNKKNEVSAIDLEIEKWLDIEPVNEYQELKHTIAKSLDKQKAYTLITSFEDMLIKEGIIYMFSKYYQHGKPMNFSDVSLMQEMVKKVWDKIEKVEFHHTSDKDRIKNRKVNVEKQEKFVTYMSDLDICKKTPNMTDEEFNAFLNSI